MAIRRAVDFDIVYTHILSAAESKQTRSVRHANESESVWLVCDPLQYSHHIANSRLAVDQRANASGTTSMDWTDKQAFQERPSELSLTVTRKRRDRSSNLDQGDPLKRVLSYARPRSPHFGPFSRVQSTSSGSDNISRWQLHRYKGGPRRLEEIPFVCGSVDEDSYSCTHARLLSQSYFMYFQIGECRRCLLLVQCMVPAKVGEFLEVVECDAMFRGDL